MDQRFGASNFRRIWDLRTRRGEDLTPFFTDVRRIALEISRLRRQAVATSAGAQYATRLNELRQEQHNLLNSNLRRISIEIDEQLGSGRYVFGIKRIGNNDGRELYKANTSEAATYFALRQVERNLRYSFNLRHTSRDLLVEQIARVVQSSGPKTVIRGDVRNFYDSLDHKYLCNLLARNEKVSGTTRRLCESYLQEYVAASGKTLGLPTGVSLSAVLSEMYMTEIDESISRLPAVSYYGRFVDDFVVILVEPDDHQQSHPFRELIEGKLAMGGLHLNDAKYEEVRYGHGSAAEPPFEYLGYELQPTANGVKIDISTRRACAMRQKLNLAFEHFRRDPFNPNSLRLLETRLKFLTSNTRLHNNKRNALIGPYFSSRMVTPPSERLLELDAHLSNLIEGGIVAPRFRSRLRNYSFVAGFEDRIFHRFSARNIASIVKVWNGV